MEKPAHIIPNRGANRKKFGSGKWVNLISDEVYTDDVALEAYLSTYRPMVYWMSWDNYKKSKAA